MADKRDQFAMRSGGGSQVIPGQTLGQPTPLTPLAQSTSSSSSSSSSSTTTTTTTPAPIPATNRDWIPPTGVKSYPYGITSDGEHIYSSDYRAKTIQIYSLQGQFLKTLPCPPTPTTPATPSSSSSSHPHQPMLEWAPGGIEIAGDYLYTIHHKTLLILDKNKYTLIKIWSLPDEGKDGGLYLKVDETKEYHHLYFTLETCHQIFLFSTKGDEIKRFGTVEKSDKKGEFHYPRGLAVDETSLYVCDRHNHRIQVLDKKGTYQRSTGSYGTQGKNEFYYPSGILLYHQFLYVTDSIRVHVLDQKSLEVVKYIGKGSSTRGQDDGEFSYPKGLCVANNTLYVSDCWNHRIQWFKL